MNRLRLRGTTAAATLPAALSAAVLVSAPFAGTTTAPLADSQHVAGAKARPETAAEQRPSAGSPREAHGRSLGVPAAAVATMAGCELGLVGVATGLVIAVRRRETSDQ